MEESNGGLFRTLCGVARTVNSSMDVMEMLDALVAETTRALGARAALLRLLGPDAEHLMYGAAFGISSGYRAKGPVLLEQSDVDREVLAQNRAVYVADVGEDPRYQYPEQAREEGLVSALVVPLLMQDRPVGVMRIYTAEQREFSAGELALAEAVASLAALAIERGRLYERLDRNYLAALEFHPREHP